jgi:hypothetical protein
MPAVPVHSQCSTTETTVVSVARRTAVDATTATSWLTSQAAAIQREAFRRRSITVEH